MTKTKKIITVALAAVALTTASLAATGNAYAKGGGHHHHFFHRGVFFATPVVYASCWKWVYFKGIYKKIYVCGY
jgi:hypothetical protein